MNKQQMLDEANSLFAQAKALIEQDDQGPENAEQRDKLFKAAVEYQTKGSQLATIEQFASTYELAKHASENPPQAKFTGVGQYLQAVHQIYDPKYRGPLHPALGTRFADKEEPDGVGNWLSKQASEHKDLLEQTGATGGFLVPVEFRAELLAIIYEDNPIRQRCNVIPMRRRQVLIPTLDQTGTAAGATRMHGGIAATWTEEATEKDETEPVFRQIALVAHKLVCYTEASDELLADEAVGLVAFLSGPTGFAGAIRWEEEWTFLRGTGAGQPLGLLNANATIAVARAAAGLIGVGDIANMLSQHHGDQPMWSLSRSAMPQLIQLNGPAANPSYIFIPNAREGLPGTLFGFPIDFTEKLPRVGQPGDILLADWRFYVVGDRQATTIDSSTHFRFRDDITAWRAVHRVDGQPQLSQPITLADGVTQISPFVILGAVAS